MDDQFALSVAMSADGTTVAVGAPHVSTADGIHYVGVVHTFALP